MTAAATETATVARTAPQPTTEPSKGAGGRSSTRSGSTSGSNGRSPGAGPSVKDLPSIAKGDPAKRVIGDAPVIPILLIITGGWLVYFGVHWWRDSAVKWPSDPIKNLLQGKQPPGTVKTETASATLTAYETEASGAGTPSIGKLPPGGSDAKNRALGKLLAARYGWGTGAEWRALDYGWGTLESSWNSKVKNSGSGALGIAQALGHGNDFTNGTLGNEYGPILGMTFATSLYVAANSGNASAQIEWGLYYVKHRYGSPTEVPGWTGGAYSGY